MAKKCPRGFVCTDWNTIFLYVLVAAMIVGGAWFVLNRAQVAPAALAPMKPTVIVVPQPVQAPLHTSVRPDLYPEPVSAVATVHYRLWPVAVRSSHSSRSVC